MEKVIVHKSAQETNDYALQLGITQERVDEIVDMAVVEFHKEAIKENSDPESIGTGGVLEKICNQMNNINEQVLVALKLGVLEGAVVFGGLRARIWIETEVEKSTKAIAEREAKKAAQPATATA